MTNFCEIFVYKVPSPNGRGLGWGRVKSVASLPFDCPPPDLPPMGGGVNATAIVPSPHGGGLGWGRVKGEVVCHHHSGRGWGK